MGIQSFEHEVDEKIGRALSFEVRPYAPAFFR